MVSAWKRGTGGLGAVCTERQQFRGLGANEVGSCMKWKACRFRLLRRAAAAGLTWEAQCQWQAKGFLANTGRRTAPCALCPPTRSAHLTCSINVFDRDQEPPLTQKQLNQAS